MHAIAIAHPRRLNAACCALLLSLTAGCGGGSGDGDNNSPGSTQGQPSAPAGGNRSTNWSGYVLSGPAQSFSKVQGSWAVPSVNCAGADGAASSSWAGIGGGNNADPTLVQAGTEQDCNGGPDYFAWWEVIPAPASRLNPQTYPVGAGDRISVSADGSSAIVWSIRIANDSRGWVFSTSVPYGAAGATAEWIEEAPLTAGTGGAGQSALADFGRVAFSALTANGGNPGLSANERVVMVDGRDGHVVANPSAPGVNGNAFAVCFGSGACR